MLRCSLTSARAMMLSLLRGVGRALSTGLSCTTAGYDLHPFQLRSGDRRIYQALKKPRNALLPSPGQDVDHAPLVCRS